MCMTRSCMHLMHFASIQATFGMIGILLFALIALMLSCFGHVLHIRMAVCAG